MRRWRAGVTVCGLALVLVAGCNGRSVAPRAQQPAAPTSSPVTDPGTGAGAPPLVGSCVTIDTSGAPSSLRTPASTDCGGAHNAEVVFVLNTALASLDHYPTTRDVADRTGLVGQNLRDVCNNAMIFRYLNGGFDGPHSYDGDVFAAPASFLPSPRQWAAGARWVECAAFYGIWAPQISPGRLAGALRRENSAAYRLCFIGTPSAFDFTPCSRTHNAESIGYTVDARTGTPYPHTRAARRVIAQECSPSLVSYVGGRMPAGYTADVYLPPRASWAAQPFAYCVLVRLDRATTATSVDS